MNRARLRPGDLVLFEGGRTFSDSTLMPVASGAPGAPITYGSYGSGRATIANPRGAVWFSGRSHLTFRGLRLTTGGAAAVIFAGSSAGSHAITVSGCVLADSADAAVNSPSPDDSGWLIEDSTISHVGDSGIIVEGSGARIVDNTIADTGWNPALAYGKHGVYVKGPNAVIRGNRISRFAASGITLRSYGARAIGNRIERGPFGVSYFDESARNGRSYVVGNVMAGIGQAGFFYGGTPGDAFVVTGNTVSMAGGVGFDIELARYTPLVLAGNRLLGRYRWALVGRSFAAPGAFVETNDAFAGRPRFSWDGRSLSLAAYRRRTGQGRGDSLLGTG